MSWNSRYPLLATDGQDDTRLLLCSVFLYYVSVRKIILHMMMDEGGARIVSAQRVQRQFASCRLHIPDGCNAVCHSWLDESTTTIICARKFWKHILKFSGPEETWSHRKTSKTLGDQRSILPCSDSGDSFASILLDSTKHRHEHFTRRDSNDVLNEPGTVLSGETKVVAVRWM